MSSLALAMASSHAFAVESPTTWDTKRARNRQHYADRYGTLPDETAAALAETDDELNAKWADIDAAFGQLRSTLVASAPDLLVFICDDQDELFTDGNHPQLGMWLGGDFVARASDRDQPPHRRRALPDVAERIHAHCVGEGFDVSTLRTVPDQYLLSHALGPVLEVIDPEGRVPVLPVFVNAIHPPAPTPARCYGFGRSIRTAIDQLPGDLRIAVYGSGGLSHYPSSFPPGHHGNDTPFPWGTIDETFDRQLLDAIAGGRGSLLAELDAVALMEHGEAELLCWITALGVIGEVAADMITYHAVHRAIMGIAVACWELEMRTST